MIEWPAPDGVTSRLILIRHGEPDESLRGRCYGRLDAGLSPHGRRQLQQTSERLAGARMTAFYCSPRVRAVESAEILAADQAVTIRDDLRELDFGRVEGLTYLEIAERFPLLFAQWMAAPTTVTFPEGEPFIDMAARVRAAIAEIRAAHPGGSVAIVSHGGVNRIAIADALGLPLEHIFTIDQGYAGMNVIDYFGETPLVRLINAVPDSAC
jgi:alpha-ribazole phosphatase